MTDSMTENITDASVTTGTRNSRKVRQGVVVSISGDKSRVVAIRDRKQHPKYGKMITSIKKLHVHDEENETSVGDTVSVMETRPLSKNKHWRLVEIVEKAK
jgi:small subunit ribosomal protein S17